MKPKPDFASTVRAVRRNAKQESARATATKSAGSDGDETISESQRLVLLEELEQVYAELGLHLSILNEDDPPPSINIPSILDRMKKLPSKLYQLHSKGPGRAFSGIDHKHSKKSTGSYEMNQFREMVVLSLVEMKREQQLGETGGGGKEMKKDFKIVV